MFLHINQCYVPADISTRDVSLIDRLACEMIMTAETQLCSEKKKSNENTSLPKLMSTEAHFALQ